MVINTIKNLSFIFSYRYGYFISVIIQKTLRSLSYQYYKNVKRMNHFNIISSKQKKELIFEKTKEFAIFAYENTIFYKKFYDSKGFSPYNLKHFDDILTIPIVNKQLLLNVPLSERTVKSILNTSSNTGGSTGNPLSLSFSILSVYNEFAHKHKNWSYIGYDSTVTRVMFIGRYKPKKNISYDFIQNALIVNTYVGWDLIYKELFDTIKKHKQKKFILHGYPSIIVDFLHYLKNLNINIPSGIIGIISVSEMLHDNQIKIFNKFNLPFVSTYGHTERCILARAVNNNIYECIHSYGYTEAIINSNNKYELVGTNFLNNACPLIRYATEDIITPNYKNGLLIDFIIDDGRNGDFVLDKNYNKIFLTAFIFGRHHEIFNFSTSIQVFQDYPGNLIILVVLMVDVVIDSNEIHTYFNLEDLNIDISFKFIDKPIKTKNGKQMLLVNSI